MGADRIVELYARELAYLREQGREFAKANPVIAPRLAVSGRQSSDPHVERLLESFAFLTARIQKDIEDEFPIITQSLLGALYPQLVCPVPAMAIASFHMNEGASTEVGVAVPKGTQLFVEPRSGPTCRFRTGFGITLWPLSVLDPSLDRADAVRLAPGESRGAAVKSLVLPIRVASGDLAFDHMRIDRLRFFLGGERREACRLYDLLFAGHGARAYVRKPGLDQRAVRAKLVPVGFGVDEDLLPYPDNAQPAHRLVQEYFAFPEKFLFVDVMLPEGSLPEGPDLEVVFLLDVPPPASLELSRESFQLGCTPIANLFTKSSEPIRLDRRTHEYKLHGDVRRERTTEIHSIQRVFSTRPDLAVPAEHEPFFSYVHSVDDGEPRAYWHARRAPSSRRDVPGSEIWLSIVDERFRPALDVPAETVFAQTLCTNRDLADEIDAGTRLQFELAGVAATAICSTKPTRQVQPPADGEALWRLVSTLTLGHLSLAAPPGAPSRHGDAGGGAALREVLRAFLFTEDVAAERQILGVSDLEIRTVTRRIRRAEGPRQEAWRGWCTGSELTAVLAEEHFAAGSLALFGTVLSHFFARYAHLNSFTELVVKKPSSTEEWKRWPLMAGDAPLI
jgi:type VI secretion system protein ImpG